MMQSRGVTIAIQVASMILFALISAAAPGYMLLFFIIYFAIIMLITSKMAMGGLKKVEQMKGSPIFKEENATTVMASDTLLIQEVKEQFKSPMLMMILSFAFVLIIPPVYWSYISPYIENLIKQSTTNEFVVRFIVFLAFYVFMIAVLYLPRTLIMRGIKQKKQLYYPRVYAIYKEGVVIEGRLLEYSRDMCYKVNSKRHFVEIHGDKLPFIVRLYTLETSKLADRLYEVGLRECRA
ncbi:MAG: DUF2208 family protein [Desulfurococcaceae archaeon]